MVKVQRGDPVLPPHFKVVQEDNFMAKVNEVVEALSVSTVCKAAPYSILPGWQGTNADRFLVQQSPLPKRHD